jgi:hypothetical protein
MRDSDIEERRNGKLGIDFGRKFLIILYREPKGDLWERR